MAPPRGSGLFDTEPPPPPPPPPPPGGARTRSPTAIRASSPQAITPPPTAIAKETPSPPSKRRRGRSTPPTSPRNPELPSPPRPRSWSTPPSPTRGEIMSSEDKAMGSASHSGHNRCMIRTKLDYSPDNVKENDISGPVAIFWDIENCPVPKDAMPNDIYGNVRRALGMHQILNGDVTKFCAYGDFSLFSTRILEELRTSGIQAEHVSHEYKKDAADKVILAEMLFFGLDNPVPSSIMLISGDVDFARALHGLRQRTYTIAIAIPSAIHVSSDLTSAAEIVWDWPSLARGKGVGMPRRLACPGDVLTLKDEIIELLESTNDGVLPLSRIPGAYLKHFSRPLIITHYGYTKLDDFFEKLGHDSFLVLGGRASKLVYLNTNSAPEESGGSHQLGSSLEQVKMVTGMRDLQEDQDSKVPSLVINDVECDTKDVDATDKEKMDVEVVETGPSSQVTPVPELKKKRQCHRHHRRH